VRAKTAQVLKRQRDITFNTPKTTRAGSTDSPINRSADSPNHQQTGLGRAFAAPRNAAGSSRRRPVFCAAGH
jgi:hypothetical protein